MGAIDAVKKGEVDAEKGSFQRLRHPVARNPVQIDDQRDCGLPPGDRAQDPHAARLDQAGDGRRRAGDHAAAFGAQFGPIVGDKVRTMGHELQAKRRLARPRRAKDENGARPDRDGCSVNEKGRVVSHAPAPQTGRPTTKRAPSGSDVMSAEVGRMFSAQITPPCASTICLEMARPRPELLPKCASGRCE